MKKFKTFIFFILLVLIWSLIFWLYKYYFWWIYQNIDEEINLQTITWYTAVWLFLAYITWWIITKIFSKKTLLVFVWIVNILCLVFLYIFWLNSIMIFNIITVLIGFFYWIWSVLKLIIAWIEIEKTWISDTWVNAIITIAYIVMLIAGSILGSLMSEKIASNWIWVISFLILLTSIFSVFMNYENEVIITDKKEEFKKQSALFLSNTILIIKEYILILIPTWILWSVSTIISQKAIEYSVTNFHKTSSEAAMLLLYSAVWVIIGSIVSVFMTKKKKKNLEILLEEDSWIPELIIESVFKKNKRWYYFNAFNAIFIIVIFLFPTLISTYNSAIMLAAGAWFLFWIISNLIDAFYINKITQDNNKEYGWAFHWVMVNLIVFLMMFWTNAIEKNYWFNVNFYFIGSLVIIASLMNIYYVKNKLWNS